MNVSAPLFPSLGQVLFTLHLLYEDSKLNKFHWKSCPVLAPFLSRLSADLNLSKFVQHYWWDFPTVCHSEPEKAKTFQVSADLLSKLDLSKLSSEPPSIFKTLQDILKGVKMTQPFPILGEVTSRTRDLTLVFVLFVSKGGLIEPERFVTARDLKDFEPCTPLNNAGRIIDYVVSRGFNSWTVQSIPIGFSIPILSAIYQCRLLPPLLSWKSEAFNLIGRPELSDGLKSKSRFKIKDVKSLTTSETTEAVEDGLEDIENEVTRLRWPDDQRLSDVRKMLQSARPVIIGVQQRPEVSDHDFVEEQERSLQSLCIRTMALPVGRGAISFQTAMPLPTEPVSIPRLCLTGKAPPRGTTVEMDHIDVVPHMDRWPSFHNGVAAGLRIPSNGSDIDSNWITFNKPREGNSHPNDLVEHGGFLMALGLNGHLAKLGKLESFDYLVSSTPSKSNAIVILMLSF